MDGYKGDLGVAKVRADLRSKGFTVLFRWRNTRRSILSHMRLESSIAFRWSTGPHARVPSPWSSGLC